MKKVLAVVLMALVAMSGCATNGTASGPGSDVDDNHPTAAQSQPPLLPGQSSHERAVCVRTDTRVGTVINGEVMVAEGFPVDGQVAATNVAGIALGALLGFGFVRYRTCKNPAFPVEATVRPLSTFSAEEIKVLNERRASNGEPPVGTAN